MTKHNQKELESYGTRELIELILELETEIALERSTK